MTRRYGLRWFALPVVAMVVSLGLSGSPASATTAGWVDLSYGVSGLASLPATTLFGTTVVDPTGRAVVLGAGNDGGSADRLTRLTVSGAIDPSFATGGAIVLPTATIYTQVVIDASGAIYLLGGEAAPGTDSLQIIVTKLTSAGALDTNFGVGGTSNQSVATFSSPGYTNSSLAVRNDGDVVITLHTKDATHTGFVLALTPTGAVDTAFGTATTPGWLAFPAGDIPYAVTASASGNSVGVLVGNIQNTVPKFFFQTYSSVGLVGISVSFATSQVPFALAAAADGTFFVTGSLEDTAFLGHIAASGAISVVQGPPEDCSPAGGQIAVSGSQVYVIAYRADSSTNCEPSPAFVLRFTAGVLDLGFGSGGQVIISDMSALTTFGPNGGGLQPDGHLLVGINGSTDPALQTGAAAVIRLNTVLAAPAVEAFVQGANDTFFSAEHVADNPNSFTGTPSPVVDAGNFTDVFLLGTDGHLFVSRRLPPGWTAPVDVTAALPGAPSLKSPPKAVLDGTILHVFALAASTDHLVDYHNDGPGGTWMTTDVTSSDPGAPAIGPSLSAVRLSGTLHVYGTTIAGNLVEIDNDNQAGHQWNFYDETSSAGGGVATAGAPGALLINAIPHVYTRASGSNDLVEFVADHVGGRIWNAYDQTQSAPGSPTLSGNPIPTLIGAIPHVYVDDARNGDLVEFVADHLAGRIWNSYDQTTGSGAPPLVGNPSVVLVDGAIYGQPGIQVPEVFENASGVLAVVAADHQDGSIWNAYNVTSLSGGSGVTGDPSVVLNGAFVEVLSLTTGQGAIAVSANQQAHRSLPAAQVQKAPTVRNGAPGRLNIGPFEQAAQVKRALAIG